MGVKLCSADSFLLSRTRGVSMPEPDGALPGEWLAFFVLVGLMALSALG
jgi:hypothetical protein